MKTVWWIITLPVISGLPGVSLLPFFRPDPKVRFQSLFLFYSCNWVCMENLSMDNKSYWVESEWIHILFEGEGEGLSWPDINRKLTKGQVKAKATLNYYLDGVSKHSKCNIWKKVTANESDRDVKLNELVEHLEWMLLFNNISFSKIL